jgi:hypothetical protein
VPAQPDEPPAQVVHQVVRVGSTAWEELQQFRAEAAARQARNKAEGD